MSVEMPLPSGNITAVLFDLDDTLNDRCATWAAFVTVLRAKYRERIVNEDERAGVQMMLSADRGGYRLKDEVFAELSARLFRSHAPTPKELEAFWLLAFPACTGERTGAKY